MTYRLHLSLLAALIAWPVAVAAQKAPPVKWSNSITTVGEEPARAGQCGPCTDDLKTIRHKYRALIADNKALADEVTKGQLLAGKIPKFRSTEGYRNTRWGMTRKQIRKRFPMAEENSTGDLYLETLVAGKPAITGFVFTDNKLIQVVILFSDIYANDNTYIDDHRRVKRLLSKKYGRPLSDQEYWTQREYEGDPDHWGMAVSGGQLTLFARWSTPKTAIEHVLSGDNFDVTHRISYRSRELAAVEAQRLEAHYLESL